MVQDNSGIEFCNNYPAESSYVIEIGKRYSRTVYHIYILLKCIPPSRSHVQLITGMQQPGGGIAAECRVGTNPRRL